MAMLHKSKIRTLLDLCIDSHVLEDQAKEALVEYSEIMNSDETDLSVCLAYHRSIGIKLNIQITIENESMVTKVTVPGQAESYVLTYSKDGKLIDCPLRGWKLK
jgi:hypothetical protein